MDLANVLEALRLQRFPCHLSWLEETLKQKLDGDCTLEEKKDFVTTKWLHGCYKPSNEDKEVQDEVESESILDQCSPQNPRYAALFSRNLNQVVRSIYGGDLEGAKEKLKQLRGYLPELKGEEHGRLKEPLEYLMECAQWALGKLEDGDDDEKPMILEVDGLRRKWKGLQTDPKSVAVLKYMKIAVKSPGRREEGYLTDLLQVVELDPSYFIWRHYVYQALRLNRRESDKASGLLKKVKFFSAPCPMEIEMAQKAYEVAAGNPKPEMVVADMVSMLLDCLMLDVYPKMSRHVKVERCPLEDPLEARNTLLKLTDDLLERPQNPGNIQIHHLKNVIRKAEVLLQIRSTKESREEGLKLLLDTLNKYPDSGFLWWKLGRIYKNGVPDNLGMTNLTESRKCFKEAIKLKQRDSYFKCLREYLNLLPNPPPPVLVEEALGFLTEAEEESGNNNGLIWRDSQAVDVGIWRGFLLWVFYPLEGGVEVNRKEACKSWSKIWMQYPQIRDSILMNIQNPSFRCYQSVDMEELTRFLVSLKWEGDLDRDQKEAVTGLLEEVVKWRGGPRRGYEADRSNHGMEREDFRNGNAGGYRQRGRQMGSTTQSWKQSAADLDDNWRK